MIQGEIEVKIAGTQPKYMVHINYDESKLKSFTAQVVAALLTLHSLRKASKIYKRCGLQAPEIWSVDTYTSIIHSQCINRQTLSGTPEVYCHLFTACSMTQQCL